MTTISYVFRSSTRVGRHHGRLCLRITHHRQSRTIALPIRLYEEEWHPLEQKSSSESINQQLELINNDLQQILQRLQQRADYCAEDVALCYRMHVDGYSLSFFVNQLMASYHQRGQERTARAYRTAMQRLLDFSKNPKLKLSQITADLIEDFEKSLLKEGLARNTVSFYMRNLRSIYKRAVSMQQIIPSEQSPFAQVFTGADVTRKRALNQKDINRLSNLCVNKPQLNFARRLFFFGFHARGMSFVDIAYLKKGDMKNDIIRYRRKKTGREIEVKVTQELKKLIASFSQSTKGSQYLLPIITDPQKSDRRQYESALRLQNKRLSELGKLADFEYPLTTHVARHSWASLAKELHTPLARISESLGHSDEKTTYTYLSSFDRKILDKVGENVSQMVHSPHEMYTYCFNS